MFNSLERFNINYLIISSLRLVRDKLVVQTNPPIVSVQGKLHDKQPTRHNANYNLTHHSFRVISILDAIFYR